MTLLFTALLMLCGLGAPTFATTTERKREAVAAWAAGFAAALYLLRPGALPNPAWLGLLVAGSAALEIFGPRIKPLSPLCGGVLAAVWSALLRIQGLPLAAAVTVAVVVPALSWWLAMRREGFAPQTLREEAMLMMIALGIFVAVLPEVSAGWQSALALNLGSGTVSNPMIANWVLVLSTTSALLGGAYSLLRRR